MGISLIVILVAVGLCLVALSGDPVEVVRVIDEAGRPVEGAILSLGNIVAGGAVSSAGSSRPSVVTDSKGNALLPYPRRVDKLETTEISFQIEHPDYYSETSWRRWKPGQGLRDLFDDLERRIMLGRARPIEVVLKRGAMLTVSGYVGAPENRVERVHVQAGLTLAPRFQAPTYLGPGDWLKPTPTVQLTRRVFPGTNTLRLVHVDAAGDLLFSDLVSFPAAKNGEYRFNLELKPARRVMGKLDASVPRPIRAGMVIANVSSGLVGRYNLNWHTWTEINPDGSFQFESLPPGELELIGVCQGFVSRPGTSTRTKLSAVAAIRGGRLPQMIELTDRENRVTLMMEPSASCTIELTDQAGVPIENALVRVHSRALWSGQMGDFGYRNVKTGDTFLFESKSVPNGPNPAYVANSDKFGRVFVRNLPSGTNSISISHKEFLQPMVTNQTGRGSTFPWVVLSPGTTNSISLALQPRTLGKK